MPTRADGRRCGQQMGKSAMSSSTIQSYQRHAAAAKLTYTLGYLRLLNPKGRQHARLCTIFPLTSHPKPSITGQAQTQPASAVRSVRATDAHPRCRRRPASTKTENNAMATGTECLPCNMVKRMHGEPPQVCQKAMTPAQDPKQRKIQNQYKYQHKNR